MRCIVAPSVLNADHGHLLQECQDVLSKGAEWLHMDIMDGHFVPNISFGMPVVASLRKHLPATYISCHLMVTHPMRWLEAFHKAGASSVIVHAESDFQKASLREALLKIRAMGMDPGVVIKPETGLEAVRAVLDEGLADLLLVMTVEPGFGGQKFREDMMGKVREARGLYPKLDIKVDGGINSQSAGVAKSAGANILVAGTAIFSSEDRAAVIQSLLEA